ncbi:MAG: hypothetical protein R6W90_16215, partial [Ignavibacteriaceae bacterium]
MRKLTAFSIIILLLLSVQVFPHSKERKDIPEKYKWNLSDIYSSDSEWQKAAGKIKTDINKIAAFKGRLGESASVLKEALQNYFNTLKELYTLSTYSNRLSDENMGITENQELNQVANIIGREFSEKTALIRPELLKIDPQQIQQFLTEEKGLAEYKMFIEDIQRMREHTLT